MARWAEIAFVPDAALAAEIVAAWQWRVVGRWTPFLCSMIGGIFLEDEGGDIYWLESGTGLVKRIAADRAAFDTLMRTDHERVDELFLVPLIERLHGAGKRPGPGQCFAFKILPIFAEGSYEVDNMWVASARETLTLAADLHEQLSNLPDGAKVEIKVVD